MLTSQASCLSYTVSVVNLYKYGIKTVTYDFDSVQNGHIKRLTDQDIQSSVLPNRQKTSPGKRHRL